MDYCMMPLRLLWVFYLMDVSGRVLEILWFILNFFAGFSRFRGVILYMDEKLLFDLFLNLLEGDYFYSIFMVI